MGIEPSRCPLCGQPNDCGIVSGASTCWCFETVIPAKALEKIPAEARGVACICKACDGATRTAGAMIAPLLMDKPIPWHVAEEADWCFADNTLFQALCLSSDGFIIDKHHGFSAHPHCVLNKA